MPIPWKTVGTPYAAFFGSIIFFQLLLPSMLMPDNGDSPSYVLDRMGDFTGVLTDQLGIGRHPAVGVLILVLAAIGMVVGCIRRPQFDVPLAVLTILSAVTVSTHFRMVGRYYFQILPWLLYFAAVAVIAGVELLLRPRERRFAAAVAAVPLLFLVGVHVKALPDDIERGPGLQPAAAASRSGRPTRRSRRSSPPSSSTPSRTPSSCSSGPG